VFGISPALVCAPEFQPDRHFPFGCELIRIEKNLWVLMLGDLAPFQDQGGDVAVFL
jgi:hypothetical protein